MPESELRPPPFSRLLGAHGIHQPFNDTFPFSGSGVMPDRLALHLLDRVAEYLDYRRAGVDHHAVTGDNGDNVQGVFRERTELGFGRRTFTFRHFRIRDVLYGADNTNRI